MTICTWQDTDAYALGQHRCKSPLIGAALAGLRLDDAFCGNCTKRDHPGKTDKNAILFTGGIGDAIALESFMTPAERANLHTIYYASNSAAELRQLFSGCPAFPKLTKHVILPFRKTHKDPYYTMAGVVADHGDIPAEDWSIMTMFPLCGTVRPYTGSSFTIYPLATPAPVPKPYVYICPWSGWGQWADRSIDAGEWDGICQLLDERGLNGLAVVGQEPTEYPATMPPRHPRLFTTGLTSIRESVELVKGAVGYIGIDSWPSILASKLFPPDRCVVKCVNQQCYDWQHVYFAPRMEFGFMRRRLEEPLCPVF